MGGEGAVAVCESRGRYLLWYCCDATSGPMSHSPSPLVLRVSFVSLLLPFFRIAGSAE